jgi:two-component system CheB/CheR fusion protein
MLARILPYRTLDNVIDGVVLTFTDISARIQDVPNRLALTLAENIVNTVYQPLVVLDNSLKIISANTSFYREFKVSAADTIGQIIYTLGNGQWEIASLHTLLERLFINETPFEDYIMEHNFPDIGQRKMRLNARRIETKLSEPQLILLSIEVNV